MRLLLLAMALVLRVPEIDTKVSERKAFKRV